VGQPKAIVLHIADKNSRYVFVKFLFERFSMIFSITRLALVGVVVIFAQASHAACQYPPKCGNAQECAAVEAAYQACVKREEEAKSTKNSNVGERGGSNNSSVDNGARGNGKSKSQ
jgi:hypothetical protein